MKKLAVLATLAMTSSVFAADSSLTIKGRFDYISNETEDTNGTSTLTSTKDSSGQYTSSYLRAGFKGKVNESTEGKLTLDFTDSNTATQNAVSEFVDEAFITKSFGMGLSLMIGKQAVMIGGMENDASSRDIYGKSKFNETVADNSTGLTLGYEIAGQNIYVQHLETNENVGTGVTDKKITGLAYYGNFMDGMITPIVSYHQTGTNRKGQYDTQLAVGPRVSWNMIVGEFDYLTYTSEKGGTNTAGNDADAELNSMVFHIRYNHDMYRPFFKYITEESEGTFAMDTHLNSVEAERNIMELGLEIVPNKDEDFRYHVVYTKMEAEEKGATTANKAEKYEDTKIYAGVAFGMNLLK